MAAQISSSEVIEGFSTSVPESEIDLLIEFIDGSDASLDANAVSDAAQTLLKLYGVRHLLTLQANAGRGTISNESSPSGAGRGFNTAKGEGLAATYYGKLLMQMDRFRAVVDVIDNTNKAAFMSIGRKYVEGAVDA